MPESLIGQIVGSYRVESLIGSGGMGQVWLGVHPQIGSRVAIKVLTRESLKQPGLVDRFFVEAKSVNAINHESIVNILDLATLPDGRPYIVMEYLDGAALSAVIKGRGPLPLGSLARAACEVLDALSAAHRAGIVHRDLKPDNIIITRKGRAKVLDFGTAKLMPSIDITQVETQTGHVLGTPSYMAPEQILPDKPIDHRTDIYAMGALLFHAVTGRKPFDAPYLYDVLRKQLRETPQPPSQLRPDLPPAYEHVILTAMAKEAQQRYQSAYDMGEALNQAVVGLMGNAYDSLSVTADARHITLAPGQRLSGHHPAATPHSGPNVIARPGTGSRSGPQVVVQAQQSSRPVRTAVIAIVAALIGAILMAVLIGDDGSAPALDAGTAAPVGDASTASDLDELFLDASAPPKADLEPPESATKTKKGTAAQSLATELLDGRDPKSIDPLELLSRAKAKAEKTFDDATLIALRAYPVAPSGTVDLSAGKDAEVVYTFQSESRAGSGEPCRYRVKLEWDMGADAAKASAAPLERGSCDEPTIRPPSCTTAQMWQKAIDNGASADGGKAKMQLWSRKSRRAPRWDVDIGSGDTMFRKTLTDRCKDD